MFWGGWFEGSPVYEKQLAMNGYEEIDIDTLYDDNIYFVGRSYCADMLECYLQSIYPSTKLEVADEVEYYLIYRYSKEE